MNQTEFDKLPGMIERKEFIDGSGYGKADLDEMRRAWVESKDPNKHDLAPENLKRMLDQGMMPVWLPPGESPERRRKNKGKKTKAKKKERYAKYYKVVLALIARFRM